MCGTESRACLKVIGNADYWCKYVCPCMSVHTYVYIHAAVLGFTFGVCMCVCIFPDMWVTKAKWLMKLIISSCLTGHATFTEGHVGLRLMTSTHAVILRKSLACIHQRLAADALILTDSACTAGSFISIHPPLKEVYMCHMANLYMVNGCLFQML